MKLRNKLKPIAAIVVVYAVVVFGYNYNKQLNETPTPQVNKTVQEVKEPITPDGIYLAINKVRAENDLPQYKRNSLLDKSSSLKCDDMAKGNYYAHKNPVTGKTGGTYVADVGVSATWVSENLNQGAFNKPEEVVASWMGSESHRASILDPRYTEIGFAVCVVPKWEKDLTVVHHKVEPIAQPQAQTQAAPQSRYDYTQNMYTSPKKTRCTHSDNGFYDDTTTCTTY